MGASAVWLSVEEMAMALVRSAVAGSGGVRRGYFPLGSRPLDFFFARDFFTDANTLVTRRQCRARGVRVRRGVRQATEPALCSRRPDARVEVGRGGDQLAPLALATPLGAVELDLVG